MFSLHVLMLRARSELDWALAVVALFHRLIADADAATIRALPFVRFNIAIMFVAHLASQRHIVTPISSDYQGNNLPLMTLVTFTLPFDSRTEMF